MAQIILKTDIEGQQLRRGKVRDIYDLGDKLLIVASDRISAFDVIMANGIPYKGIVLTQISKFWFEYLGVENHLITDDVSQYPQPFCDCGEQLANRVSIHNIIWRRRPGRPEAPLFRAVQSPGL